MPPVSSLAFVRESNGEYLAPNHYEQSERFPLARRAQCVSQNTIELEPHLLRPPHIANKNAMERQEMDTTSKGRISLERRITKDETAERVSCALQEWGRDKSAPIARVQQIAGVDRKTAAAWYYGSNPPQSEHLFNLARKIPELKAEVRRLLELELDHAESFQRDAIALLQRYART